MPVNQNRQEEEGLESFHDHVRYARLLLEREPPLSYTEEWTELLRHKKEDVSKGVKDTVVIFRFGNEWLALSTLVFQEVAEAKPFHKIPHRTGKYLLGVANVRGRLRLAFSMQDLLEIGAKRHSIHEKGKYQRLLVVQNAREQWVFPVDEVYGIFQYDKNFLENVPVTVSKSTANFLKGMLQWEKRLVGLIDEALLFNNLRKIVI